MTATRATRQTCLGLRGNALSSLGEFRQVSPETLEDVRSEPPAAYGRVHELEEGLDVEGDWKRLAALMDLAGFPVNPMTGGEVFPDERWTWGGNGDARALTTEQVAAVAGRLAATPFESLGLYLSRIFEQGWTSPHPDGDVDPLPVDDTERPEAIEKRLAAGWAELTAYFRQAASAGRQTIFWAE
jgi:hypothetical protein